MNEASLNAFVSATEKELKRQRAAKETGLALAIPTRIVGMAIQAAVNKQKADEGKWEKWVLKTFGSPVDQFAAEGIQIRPGAIPVTLGLEIELKDGTWSNTILSLPELGEFFQTTLEKEWKNKQLMK